MVVAVDVQRHVCVELGPQVALNALEGPDAGGEVVGDALHVGGVARMARAWRCSVSVMPGLAAALLMAAAVVVVVVVAVAVAKAAEAVGMVGILVCCCCGEWRRASASYNSAVFYFGEHGSSAATETASTKRFAISEIKGYKSCCGGGGREFHRPEAA
jgi:hypothetical protein